MTLAAAGSFAPQGPVARTMADLWWLMLVLGVIVFALFLWLLLAGLRRRHRPDRPEPSGTGGAAHGRWLILGGVVLPAVVIAAVFGFTVQAMRAVPDRAPEGALTVQVIGHQWWWEVRYPEQDVITANEIHIPAGRPVAFELTSADVIHSFWVPELGGKLDLLPEDTTTLVLEADEPGEYRGSCAEFCGLQHARMGILVVAHSEADFAAWADEQSQPAVEPTDGEAERGREILLGSGCASCHAIRGVSTDPDEDGPDLTHLASRATLGAATWPNTRERLSALITRPQEVKDGIAMPPTDLGDAELEALLDYLESLR